MNISYAILELQRMKDKYGEIEVLFDCPYCGKSTKPGIVVPMAVVQQAPADQ